MSTQIKCILPLIDERLTKNDKLLKNTEYSKCIKCYNAGQKMYKLFNENNI